VMQWSFEPSQTAIYVMYPHVLCTFLLITKKCSYVLRTLHSPLLNSMMKNTFSCNQYGYVKNLELARRCDLN